MLTKPTNREKKDEPPKTEQQIQTEIQSLFRQITASVTFLPQLAVGLYCLLLLLLLPSLSIAPSPFYPFN